MTTSLMSEWCHAQKQENNIIYYVQSHLSCSASVLKKLVYTYKKDILFPFKYIKFIYKIMYCGVLFKKNIQISYKITTKHHTRGVSRCKGKPLRRRANSFSISLKIITFILSSTVLCCASWVRFWQQRESMRRYPY